MISTDSQKRVIGLLCGTTRSKNNGSGITAYLQSRLEHLKSRGSSVIDISQAPFPLGPVTDERIPAIISNSEDYTSDAVREWSKLARSLSGLVIISPQYYWGYPGELKNCFDHLFNEWKDLPVAIVTYGGHGGGKAGLQLRQVLEGGLHVKLVSQGELEITLPKSYITGPEHVNYGSDGREVGFLHAYQETADSVLSRLIEEASKFHRL
jgi:NAD(P)H-dependent FMN reductase